MAIWHNRVYEAITKSFVWDDYYQIFSSAVWLCNQNRIKNERRKNKQAETIRGEHLLQFGKEMLNILVQINQYQLSDRYQHYLRII